MILKSECTDHTNGMQESSLKKLAAKVQYLLSLAYFSLMLHKKCDFDWQPCTAQRIGHGVISYYSVINSQYIEAVQSISHWSIIGL